LEARERAPRHAALVAPDVATWQGVARRLTPDAAFIEYLVSDSTTLAFVVTSDTIAVLDLGTRRQEPAREINQSRELLASRAEIEHRNRIAGHDERERGRVAHQVLDERCVRRESPRHALPCSDIGRHKGRMPRRALARLEQKISISLLCAQQRLAGRARVERDLGTAERLVRQVWLLQIVRQLADP